MVLVVAAAAAAAGGMMVLKIEESPKGEQRNIHTGDKSVLKQVKGEM